MSNTLKFGNGQWAVKEGSTLAYNDENNNFKPLPFNFERGSSATVVNKDGLIETVGSDMPRIDYKDDSEGALLLEPQSTNLHTYSSDLASVYIPTNITQTSNYGISPDGTLNSTRIVLSNLTDSRSVETFTSTLTSGTTYTFSCYYKGIKGETTYMNFLKNPEGLHTFKEIVFTGEWQRESITFTAGSASNYTYIVDVRRGASTATDFEVFGAQLEEKSYATSYIPTQGSAVTRLADSCSQTAPDGVIGHTEGTMFVDCKINAQGTYTGFSLSDGTTSNEVITRFTTTNRIEYYLRSGGSQPFGGGTTAFDTDSRVRIALAYKGGDSVFYVNGTEVASSTSTTIPLNLSKVKFSRGNNTASFSGKTNDFKIYNTRLSNAELKALTT